MAATISSSSLSSFAMPFFIKLTSPAARRFKRILTNGRKSSEGENDEHKMYNSCIYFNKPPSGILKTKKPGFLRASQSQAAVSTLFSSTPSVVFSFELGGGPDRRRSFSTMFSPGWWCSCFKHWAKTAPSEAKRGAFLMRQEQNERAKRIGWVSLVVDVAIMSVAISRESSRVCSSSSRLARFARSPSLISFGYLTPIDKI